MRYTADLLSRSSGEAVEKFQTQLEDFLLYGYVDIDQLSKKLEEGGGDVEVREKEGEEEKVAKEYREKYGQLLKKKCVCMVGGLGEWAVKYHEMMYGAQESMKRCVSKYMEIRSKFEESTVRFFLSCLSFFLFFCSFSPTISSPNLGQKQSMMGTFFEEKRKYGTNVVFF